MTLPKPAKDNTLSFNGISHLLLDIEGTTCPVSFVTQTLFPYVAEQLPCFLHSNSDDPAVKKLVRELQNAWEKDTNPEARALADAGDMVRAGNQSSLPPGALEGDEAVSVLPYLRWLSQKDIKLTPWKELQGLIWRYGYDNGQLIAPLFEDVPGCLHQWRHQGVVLAVYSSGSVAAQQLLYQHSIAGDLTNLFSHWFDTRIGAKNNQQSYAAIAQTMAAAPAQVLFISDAISELEAAQGAGMNVVFSQRPGNPQTDAKNFKQVLSFRQLRLAYQ